MAERIDLRIAQKIQVSRDEKTWYNASIQNTGPNVLYITIPYLREHPLVLRRGDKVQVRFFLDDSSYHFETQVTGEAADNIHLYRLAYPDQITRVQQRDYVRLPVMLDVEYAPADAGAGAQDPAFTRATSVDISGGGMKLAVKQRVRENSSLLLRFVLPLKSKPEFLELKARVIRCIRTDSRREVYHLGLRYESINLRQQDIIVRFIFEKMALQKRLL